MSEVVAFPAVLGPVTAVRGSLIVSSLAALRDAGHFDRYQALLPEASKDDILYALASSWVDIELAMIHYGACDQLGLSAQETVALGEGVGDRIQGRFMVALARTMRAVGVTPWTLLGQFDRLWGRLMQGGGVAVIGTGPKDARVEVAKLPLLQHAYFRQAFNGVINVGFRLVGTQAFTVRIEKVDLDQLCCTYRLSWV